MCSWVTSLSWFCSGGNWPGRYQASFSSNIWRCDRYTLLWPSVLYCILTHKASLTKMVLRSLAARMVFSSVTLFRPWSALLALHLFVTDCQCSHHPVETAFTSWRGVAGIHTSAAVVRPRKNGFVVRGAALEGPFICHFIELTTSVTYNFD